MSRAASFGPLLARRATSVAARHRAVYRRTTVSGWRAMSAGFHQDETAHAPAEQRRGAAEALIAACYDDMRRVARRIIAAM